VLVVSNENLILYKQKQSQEYHLPAVMHSSETSPPNVK
jgi:hypothetical protein